MAPFIHHNDVISVAPLGARPVRCGDILAFIAPRDGRLLVHRAVQTSPAAFLCKGDNIPLQNDGWVPAEAVLGRVIQIQRGGKQKRLGLGAEKVLIALLSRWGVLVPLLNALRRVRGAFRR